ncbi:MAG: SocA family protein [Alphaproteobacteria bacterium]|nr:SocA family protein [Alphaproteobacteria bacterium]
MHDARAVSNFFIERAAQEGLALSVMTLLKVLYFAHAWHLVKTSSPLVAQPFEAWRYGPVSRVVYDQYKDYGKRPIDKLAVSFDPTQLKYVPTASDFDVSTKHFLSNIFDYYSRFAAFHLSDLTHEVGSPWHTVWTEAQQRAVPGMIIPNELILSWFQKTDDSAIYKS